MSRMVSRRDHSAHMPSFDPPGPPFVPQVGDVFLVVPYLLYSSTDTASVRPAVVIEVPERIDARIRIVTRTSDLRVGGIRHGVAPQLGLDRPGVWSNLVSVERSLWCPQAARWKGPLESAILEDVLERFL